MRKQRICTGHSGVNYYFFNHFFCHVTTIFLPLFLLPFTTFTILQNCQCKLAILHLRGFVFTNDPLPRSAVARLRLSSILNIFPLETYHSHTFLFLSLEYCKTSFSVIDFTLGFLTSASLGGFLQTFICNLILSFSSRVFE